MSVYLDNEKVYKLCGSKLLSCFFYRATSERTFYWWLIVTERRVAPGSILYNEVVKIPKPVKKATKRMFVAAEYSAQGKSCAEIAELMGVTDGSVRAWLANADVRQYYIDICRAALPSAIAKARQVLINQLSSDKANGFLAQNAANSLLNRYDAQVMGEEQQQLTVNFTAGTVPVIGMPASADEGNQ